MREIFLIDGIDGAKFYISHRCGKEVVLRINSAHSIHKDGKVRKISQVSSSNSDIIRIEQEKDTFIFYSRNGHDNSVRTKRWGQTHFGGSIKTRFVII